MKRRKSLEEVPSEYTECLTYYKEAQYHPMLKEYLIKHVNEGKRSKILGRLLKLIGLRKGLLDYQYPVPNNKYIGLWIEMKTSDRMNHRPDKDQDLWIERLLRIGHYATYAYGAGHAIEITMAYLENRI